MRKTKYFIYTPQKEAFEMKDFKSDRNFLNLVRNMSYWAADKNDKKFMKNFASQFPDCNIDTSTVKKFVESLWRCKILIPSKKMF
jgi:hypothetical protein